VLIKNHHTITVGYLQFVGLPPTLTYNLIYLNMPIINNGVIIAILLSIYGSYKMPSVSPKPNIFKTWYSVIVSTSIKGYA
jgi:hypothetical protein